MRVDLDRFVRVLPEDDSHDRATPLATRAADLAIVRAEIENPSPDADDASIESFEPDRDAPDSLTVIVEWFQKLAGAEWQWS
jgi:hypothetical protein